MQDRDRPPQIAAVENLQVSLSVVLAERALSVDQVLDIQPGAVLDLGGHPDAPLELRFDGSPVGRGRAVDVGESLGFLVEELRPIRRRDPREPV